MTASSRTHSPLDVHVFVVTHLAAGSSESERALFLRTLGSLHALGGPETLPITVIDNASPLDLRALLQSLPFAASIEVIRRSENGLGAARDQALRMAQTEWVGFVDSDVEVPSRWLAAMAEALEASQLLAPPVVGIATCNVPPSDGNEFVQTLALFLSSRFAHLGSSQAVQLQVAREVVHLSTCAVLFHRQAALAAGGFDPHFSRVCEDMEFSHRLRRQGRQLLLPQPAVLHHQSDSYRDWLPRMFRYGWGQIDVARKHPRHLLGVKGLPLIALVFLLGLAALALVGSPLPLLAVLWSDLMVCLAAFTLAGAVKHAPIRRRLAAVAMTTLTHGVYMLGMAAGLAGFYRHSAKR